jgi:CTP:molybdopterin cytidylyltransferase MocA
VIPAVVIAAGLGTRLRPLTERYAKPVLPIDGKPVLALLLRELAAAGCTDVTLVIGHLGEQVERLVGDGSRFGVDVRYAHQESPDGSAHAVVQVFAAGELGRFADAFRQSGAAGALAVQARPGTVELRDGLVERVLGAGMAGAPLWAVGPGVAPYVEALPGQAPYELATAFQHAIDAGEQILGIEIGATRDLTTPLDLLEENFPYLKHL